MPRSTFCFSTMLMMPAMPSGSYLAEGFGTTSTRSRMPAGRLLRYAPSCWPEIGAGRPLIWMATFSLPQADLAIGVDGDRRRGLEHLARVGRRGRDVLGAVRVAIGLDRHGVLLPDDLYLSERHGDAGE